MNHYPHEQKETVSALFRQLEAERLNYAILRNSKDFPAFGHDIDLVLDSNDLPRWRQLITSFAKELNWDAVTECHHWANSASPHQNIEVFRLYRKNPVEYLQIDIFHGYLLWGLPLLTEQELLAFSIPDERGFKKINPGVEQSFRMLQIDSLLRNNGAPDQKSLRYRNEVLNEAVQNPEQLLYAFNLMLKSDLTLLLNTLNAEDYTSFQREIGHLKKKFLIRSLLQAPLQTLTDIRNRFQALWTVYGASPCGLSLNVYLQEITLQTTLYQALEILVSAKVFPAWRHTKDLTFLKRRKLLERGGILLNKLSTPQSAALVITKETDVQHKILEWLIHRHSTLWEKPLS